MDYGIHFSDRAVIPRKMVSIARKCVAVLQTSREKTPHFGNRITEKRFNARIIPCRCEINESLFSKPNFDHEQDTPRKQPVKELEIFDKVIDSKKQRQLRHEIGSTYMNANFEYVGSIATESEVKGRTSISNGFSSEAEDDELDQTAISERRMKKPIFKNEPIVPLQSEVRKPAWMPTATGRREVYTPGPNPRQIPLPTGKVPWKKGPSSLPSNFKPQTLNPTDEAQSIAGGAPAPPWLKPKENPSKESVNNNDSNVPLPRISRLRGKIVSYKNPSFTRNTRRIHQDSTKESFQTFSGSEVNSDDEASKPESGSSDLEEENDRKSVNSSRSLIGISDSQRESDNERKGDPEEEMDSNYSTSDQDSEHEKFTKPRKPQNLPLPPPVGNPEIAPLEPWFDYKFSYTETPKVEPIGFRGPQYSPFGPSTMSRPWTGGAPMKKSKKNIQKIPRVTPEFDSFLSVVPKGVKGVKSVEPPGPLREGEAPKYVTTREEVMGEPLTEEEIRELLEDNRKERRQLHIGRDGLVHNMLDNIHSHWKRRRVCRIKCKGVPTVDMDNVCRELEDKTGGKVIYKQRGTVYLYRGRYYNHRLRPRIPLMLWKPHAPIYPRLIEDAPEGLSLEEANNLRKAGNKIRSITKLGKNGVYTDLVDIVRDGFQCSELVKVDCKGLEKSDYKKIGSKLRDLVPCVLLSFEKEQILMWSGKRTTESENGEFEIVTNNSQDVAGGDPEDSYLSKLEESWLQKKREENEKDISVDQEKDQETRSGYLDDIEALWEFAEKEGYLTPVKEDGAK